MSGLPGKMATAVAETIKKPNVDLDTVIENIDIGGPSMLRSAAKNFAWVGVVVDSNDYNILLEQLRTTQAIVYETRFKLAKKAFAHTAQYDAIISQYLRYRWSDNILPDSNTISMRKIQDMRYGENPHQKGAFYKQLPSTDESCSAPSASVASATRPSCPRCRTVWVWTILRPVYWPRPT